MTYLPKGELVGVLSPSTINPKDIGNVWTLLGGILNPIDSSSTGTLCYIGNGIALAGMSDNTATGDHILRTVDYAAGLWTDLGIISSGTGRFTDSVYVGFGIVLFVDNIGHVYRSIDFGVNWTDQGAIAGANGIESISNLGNGIIIFCTTNGHIFRSTTSGGTWTDLGDITGTTNPLRMTTYLENGIAIAGADNQHVYRSTNFGSSWSDLGVVTTEAIRFASFYLGNGIAIITSRTFAVNARIWRSIDFGLTWVNVFTFVGINVFNDGLYLGDGISIIGDSRNPGHIFRSINFGLTWTDLGVIAASGAINRVAYLDNGVVIAGDTGNNIIMNNISYKTEESLVLIDPSFITTTVSVTIGQSHNTVNVNATGGNRVIVLETISILRVGHEFIIKKIDSSINTVTITPGGGETIDGAVSKVLTQQWESIIIRSNGTAWFSVSGLIDSGPNFTPGHLKPAITRYIMPGWSIANVDVNAGLGAGVIYYIPIFVTDTTTYTELAINVFGAGSAGNNIDMRLYAWNDGVPGAQLASLGVITTNVNGVRTLAISQTLNRGFYFLAARNNAIPVAPSYKTVSWAEAVSPPVVGMAASNNPSVLNYTNSVVLTVTAAYADPAPAPTGMSITVLAIILKEN